MQQAVHFFREEEERRGSRYSTVFVILPHPGHRCNKTIYGKKLMCAIHCESISFFLFLFLICFPLLYNHFQFEKEGRNFLTVFERARAGTFNGNACPEPTNWSEQPHLCSRATACRRRFDHRSHSFSFSKSQTTSSSTFWPKVSPFPIQCPLPGLPSCPFPFCLFFVSQRAIGLTSHYWAIKLRIVHLHKAVAWALNMAYIILFYYFFIK